MGNAARRFLVIVIPIQSPVSFLRWKSNFDGSMIAWPPVGEATSLPGGATLQNGGCSGEFVQPSNILPFNQPLKNRNIAGICSLPYRGWVVIRPAKFLFLCSSIHGPLRPAEQGGHPAAQGGGFRAVLGAGIFDPLGGGLLGLL